MSRLSPILTEHLMEPRNSGVLPSNTAVEGRGENPACGDVLVIYLDRTKDGTIEAAFQARGCSAVIAVASMVTGAAHGGTPAAAAALSVKEMVEEAGGLDRMQSHAVRVVKRALGEALGRLGS
ncbi:MAG: NifU-like protein involved in Fe-S cluster formation [Bacteroidia bacterium]|jgi:NifU-like protein involved in Fe-S cluster formation